jgi:DNA processing protein
MTRGIENDERAYWLALHRAHGVGAATLRRIVHHFGSPKAAIEASPGELTASGLSEAIAAAVKRPDWTAVESDLRWLSEPGHHLLRFGTPDYPRLLREIPDPPPLLFVVGDPTLLSRPQLAVVGSRNPSRDGAQNAFEFSRALAAQGLVITSGLALGIDAAAHRGALKAEGATVAVAGTGLDQVYPARHKELARQIAETGAIVSEFPLGVSPAAENFPRRNRIISGLSAGTLVIEAAPQSGSLITAKYAMEQGREVFAIPGSIHNPLARGCHALIRQGAKLVESTDDIFEELHPSWFGAPAPPMAETVSETLGEVDVLDPDYQRLLDCLGYDPVAVDAIVERSGLTVSEVSSMLLILELRGHVRSQPGGMYVRQHAR